MQCGAETRYVSRHDDELDQDPESMTNRSYDLEVRRSMVREHEVGQRARNSRSCT